MAKAEAAAFCGSIPWPLARLKVFAELQTRCEQNEWFE